MKIRILVNQVGDADAIFIGLSDENRSLVVLLDGGRKKDVKQLKARLDVFLASYGKQAPELVIASHYDDDHIGGLQPLIAPFGKAVQQLWAFDTQNLHHLVANPAEEDSILPSENDVAAGAAYLNKTPEISALIESIKREQELLKYARGHEIKTVQPVAKECSLEGWPEMVILSPSRTYYDSLFPQNLKLPELLVKADEARATEIKAGAKAVSGEPCHCLTLKKSPISPVNLNSCILKITIEGRVFVFAADAGIDSFYSIKDYRVELKNIFWLKVPHHGSSNNLNRELIELMSPEIAVISGDRHVSPEIIRCFEKRGTRVITTQSGDFDETFYPNTDAFSSIT